MIIHLWENYEENGNLIMEYIKSNYPCLITLEKEFENPHYHLIIDYPYLIKKFNNELQRKFKWKPKQISKSECKDLVASVIYDMKEGKLIFNTLLEDIEKFIEDNRKYKKTKKNQTFTTMLCDTYEPINVDNIIEAYIGEKQILIKEHIIKHIITSHTNNCKGIDDYILIRFVNLIYYKFYPNYLNISSILDRISEKLKQRLINIKN